MLNVPVYGTYYGAGNSLAVAAKGQLLSNYGVSISDAKLQTVLADYRLADCRFGDCIAGLPQDIEFADGALFSPDDATYRWPVEKPKRSLGLGSLESSHYVALALIVILPIFLVWMITVALPNGSEKLVPYFPDYVSQEMGDSSLDILDRLVLKPTELEPAELDAVHQLWNQSLQALALNDANYHLRFRSAPEVGANAFALANGTVVVTDDLVKLLEDKPDALLAVLLHELGHVDKQHSLRLATRTLATTLFFSFLMGDIQGAGELVIGASSAIVASAFSREMETEADDYAFKQLIALGKSPASFADALEAIIEDASDEEDRVDEERADEEPSDNSASLLRYLSSHPASSERIDKARNFDLLPVAE